MLVLEIFVQIRQHTLPAYMKALICLYFICVLNTELNQKMFYTN
jgi:hypothetical protein